MKKQIAEFLLRRIQSNSEMLQRLSDDEVTDLLCEDIDKYIGMLKDIIAEVVLP